MKALLVLMLVALLFIESGALNVKAAEVEAESAGPQILLLVRFTLIPDHTTLVIELEKFL